jgi:DNA-binding MarR family transcriptional regulator
VLVGREGRRRLVAGIAERAGVDLPPAACFLLVRLHEDPDLDVDALCERFAIPSQVGHEALAELEERGLVEAVPGGGRKLGPGADEIVERLVAERRASLERLLDGWSPDKHEEIATLLTRLARELMRSPASGEVHAPA